MKVSCQTHRPGSLPASPRRWSARSLCGGQGGLARGATSRLASDRCLGPPSLHFSEPACHFGGSGCPELTPTKP